MDPKHSSVNGRSGSYTPSMAGERNDNERNDNYSPSMANVNTMIQKLSSGTSRRRDSTTSSVVGTDWGKNSTRHPRKL